MAAISGLGHDSSEVGRCPGAAVLSASSASSTDTSPTAGPPYPVRALCLPTDMVHELLFVGSCGEKPRLRQCHRLKEVREVAEDCVSKQMPTGANPILSIPINPLDGGDSEETTLKPKPMSFRVVGRKKKFPSARAVFYGVCNSSIRLTP